MIQFEEKRWTVVGDDGWEVIINADIDHDRVDEIKFSEPDEPEKSMKQYKNFDKKMKAFKATWEFVRSGYNGAIESFYALAEKEGWD